MSKLIIAQHYPNKWSIDQVLGSEEKPRLLNQEAFWYPSYESARAAFEKMKKEGETLIEGFFFLNKDKKTYDKL